MPRPPGGDPGLLRGGAEPEPRAVEWPPSQPIGTSRRALRSRPSRPGPHFPHFGVAHGDDFDAQGLARLLPLRHVGVHRPGSPGAALGLSPLSTPARPSGLLIQWRKRGCRHRPGPAARHPRRRTAAGAGGWERRELGAGREGGHKSRDAGKERRDVIAGPGRKVVVPGSPGPALGSGGEAGGGRGGAGCAAPCPEAPGPRHVPRSRARAAPPLGSTGNYRLTSSRRGKPNAAETLVYSGLFSGFFGPSWRATHPSASVFPQRWLPRAKARRQGSGEVQALVLEEGPVHKNSLTQCQQESPVWGTEKGRTSSR